MPLKIVQNATQPARIAIASGKGGVGKSTLTVLLAAALKKVGGSVGVLDADLYGPSIRHLLPEESSPRSVEGRIVPAVSHGIQLVSIAFFKEELIMRAPLVNRLLKEFFHKIQWSPIDWLLIDFPPGTGDIPLTITQELSLSGALLVTTPQKVATLDVEKSIALFRKMQVPIIGLVENMSYFKDPSCTPFGKGGGALLAHQMGIPFLGKLPIEPSFSEQGDLGKLAALETHPVLESLAKQLQHAVEKESHCVVEIKDTQEEISILWESGQPIVLKAADVQSQCPCAYCRGAHPVNSAVKFKNAEKIGRYGLRFSFTSGCSSGLYSYPLLRSFGK